MPPASFSAPGGKLFRCFVDFVEQQFDCSIDRNGVAMHAAQNGCDVDQIDDAGEWATVSDLLAGMAKCPGWRAVVTGGGGSDEWKTKLPQGVRSNDIGTLEIAELSDDETAVLSGQNHALAIILGAGHPARGIARNLFYLSRMVELGVSQTGPASAIATEIDLAKLWWRYGGGRSEDAGRLARLKVLRSIGVQFVANPVRVSFKTDDFDSATVAELAGFTGSRSVLRPSGKRTGRRPPSHPGDRGTRDAMAARAIHRRARTVPASLHSISYRDKVFRRRLVRLSLGPQHRALSDGGVGFDGIGSLGTQSDRRRKTIRGCSSRRARARRLQRRFCMRRNRFSIVTLGRGRRYGLAYGRNAGGA